jgi:hypothetical protein
VLTTGSLAKLCFNTTNAKAISTIKVVEAHTTTVNTQIFSLLHSITVNKFIKSTNKPFDWVKVDDDGSKRAHAWKDGGANDICPVGFNVDNEC